MDMRPTAYGQGTPGTRRQVPVRLGRVSRRRTPTVSPSLSHRLDVLALVLTALIVVTGGGGPPDRLGPGLQRLAGVLGRPPDTGAAVPRPGRVRQPPGHRRPHHRRGGRLPRLDLPLPPPARPRLAERRAGGRRPGPGRPRRDRRLHQAQPLPRHGALLRHHAPAGRRRGAGAPLQPRLRAGIGPSPGAATAHPALLRPPRAAGARDRRRHRHHRRRPPRRRRHGPAGRQADPDRAARHGRAPLEPRPAADRRDHRPRRGAAHGRRARAGAPLGAHPHGGDGGAGRRRLHAVLHAPPGAARGGPHHRCHRARDRRRADLPRLHVSRARGAAAPRWSATRRRRASPSAPIRLGAPCAWYGPAPIV